MARGVTSRHKVASIHCSTAPVSTHLLIRAYFCRIFFKGLFIRLFVYFGGGGGAEGENLQADWALSIELGPGVQSLDPGCFPD